MKHTKTSTSTTIQQPSRKSDAAILFLRFFIGIVIILHIIGKLQTYDNVILAFPQILGLDAATSFAITTIIEGLFAALIVLGVATRFSAIIMSIVSALAIIYGLWQGGEVSADVKLNFIYIGIYITFIISGGGYYSFQVPDLSKKCPK